MKRYKITYRYQDETQEQIVTEAHGQKEYGTHVWEELKAVGMYTSHHCLCVHISVEEIKNLSQMLTAPELAMIRAKTGMVNPPKVACRCCRRDITYYYWVTNNNKEDLCKDCAESRDRIFAEDSKCLPGRK